MLYCATLAVSVLLIVCVLALSDESIDTVEKLWQSSSELSTTKQAVSRHTRLLFVAGLEGTGHHAWNSMFEICVNAGRCEVDVNLTQYLMHFDPSKQTVHGLFGAADVSKHSTQLETVHQHLQRLASNGGQHLYLIGLCFVRRSAMLSYPNYNGVHKALDHPDISVLAALAESVGLDFRVLVLQRSAQEILASTQHRGIGGVMEPNILTENAAVLYTQLSLLDRSFYHCVQYRSLGNLTHILQDQLTDFLHPTLVRPVLPAMLATVHYSGSNSTLKDSLPSIPTETVQSATTGSNHGSTRLEGKLRRQQEKSTKEAQGKSEEVRRVEQRSARYQEWLLARRLALIDALCDTTPS